MPTDTNTRWWTVSETADRLRLHPETVRRMIAQGKLSAIQLGGRGNAVRIDPRSIVGHRTRQEGQG